MNRWFSWARDPDSYPTPQGFRRIWELECSDSKHDVSYLILDWRPTPNPPHEPGSYFVWLEVDGERGQFYLSKAESLHFDTNLISTAKCARVVKNRGRYYILPINPRKETSPRVLPPPPSVFPPPGRTREESNQ